MSVSSTLRYALPIIYLIKDELRVHVAIRKRRAHMVHEDIFRAISLLQRGRVVADGSVVPCEVVTASQSTSR